MLIIFTEVNDLNYMLLLQFGLVIKWEIDVKECSVSHYYEQESVCSYSLGEIFLAKGRILLDACCVVLLYVVVKL